MGRCPRCLPVDFNASPRGSPSYRPRRPPPSDFSPANVKTANDTTLYPSFATPSPHKANAPISTPSSVIARACVLRPATEAGPPAISEPWSPPTPRSFRTPFCSAGRRTCRRCGPSAGPRPRRGRRGRTGRVGGGASHANAGRSRCVRSPSLRLTSFRVCLFFWSLRFLSLYRICSGPWALSPCPLIPSHRVYTPARTMHPQIPSAQPRRMTVLKPNGSATRMPRVATARSAARGAPSRV